MGLTLGRGHSEDEVHRPYGEKELGVPWKLPGAMVPWAEWWWEEIRCEEADSVSTVEE